jgi:hypothetical protein
VKFSSFHCGFPTELLAFTEQVNNVHLIDLRTMGNPQVIQVSTSARAQLAAPVQLSGLSFAPNGEKLFIGLENEGIVQCEIDVKQRLGFPDGGLI